MNEPENSIIYQRAYADTVEMLGCKVSGHVSPVMPSFPLNESEVQDDLRGRIDALAAVLQLLKHNTEEHINDDARRFRRFNRLSSTKMAWRKA